MTKGDAKAMAAVLEAEAAGVAPDLDAKARERLEKAGYIDGDAVTDEGRAAYEASLRRA